MRFYDLRITIHLGVSCSRVGLRFHFILIKMVLIVSARGLRTERYHGDWNVTVIDAQSVVEEGCCHRGSLICYFPAFETIVFFLWRFDWLRSDVVRDNGGLLRTVAILLDKSV